MGETVKSRNIRKGISSKSEQSDIILCQTKTLIILQLSGNCNIQNDTPSFVGFATPQVQCAYLQMCCAEGQKHSTTFGFLYRNHRILPFCANNPNKTTTYMRCRNIRLVTSCSDMRGCMGRCRHRLGPNWIS